MMTDACVLLVEDDPVWQQTLSQILQEKGCAFHIASTYSEALSKFTMGSFDLIVIDLKLGPEEDNRDGVGLLEDAYKKGIPAVVVTGYGTPAVIKKADRYDAMRVMHKGKFQIEEFERIVDKAISSAGPESFEPAVEDGEAINELLRKLAGGRFS